MVAAARKFRANGNGFSGSGIVEGLSSDPALTTVVRNDTLSAFTAGGPCGLSESLVNPLLYEHEARARTALSGIAPENGKAFGIALGPIPADGFGTVAIHGLTIAWVLLTDPADQYAGITDDGDTTHFVSNATRGPVRILWVPEDAVADDLVAAVVMFHGFGWPTRLGTAAGDELLLPLVTKVCLEGMSPTVVPDGDYGYPLDADGTEQDVSDTQDGESLTVERRTLTLPGDTSIGAPVCIISPDDCCTEDPVDPPNYPPGDDPSTIEVDCCPDNPVNSILYATFEKLSGGAEWDCIDGAVLQLTHVGGGVWQGVNLDCPAMDDPDCIIPIDLRLSCVVTTWSLLPINMNYTAASDLTAVCNPFSVSRDFNFAATANIWPSGCDSPGFGAATFRITVEPNSP